MSGSQTYEDYLWKYLNLEEQDSQGLQELANELASTDPSGTAEKEKFFKLKLKVALTSEDLSNYTALKIDTSDVNVKKDDDYETVLLKSRLFVKHELPLNSFQTDLKEYINRAVDEVSSSDEKKDELLQFYNDNFVLKPAHITKKKRNMNFLEGEPSQEDKRSESMIEKFQDLLQNNKIYSIINNDYKPGVKALLFKIKLLVFSSYNNKDKNYYYILVLLLLLTTVLGVKGYKLFKKLRLSLYLKLRQFLRLFSNQYISS